MLKVLHILKSSAFSGAENVVITMINHYKNSVDAVYMSKEGNIRDVLNENSIKYYLVHQLSVTSIKKAISIIKPDIIHAHDFTAGIMSFATGTKIPIINHLHNNSPWIRQYGLYSFIYALSCLRYRKILTVSESVMNEYIFGKFFKHKTEVIGNPIDIDRVRRLAGETPKNAIKPYDISFLGRFSPQKNPFLFIDIINEVKKLKPDVLVIMIGDGELRSEVEKKIVELGLKENIKLVGFQKNPYPFLNQAKILLMPSSWEGFGLAAVEALALGKPVVCSGVGGLPGIVDNTCGAICQNLIDYIKNIVCLLKKATKLNNLSYRAIKRANDLNNIENYRDKILNIYEEVVDA